MTETAWHIARGPGRLYQCPGDLTIKYDDRAALIEAILLHVKAFVQLESSVRLLLSGDTVHPVTTVIAVPFEGTNDEIYRNIATLVFEQLWGYYLSADPKATHHGLTNLIYEGNETALIRRETEKFMAMLNTRHDIAGRVMRNYRMACDLPPFPRDVYLKKVTEKNLEMHLGVRMYTYGESVHRVTVFLPIASGIEALDRIYYNIEHVIHQNLVAYDELHEHYLPVSEELILRELEAVLVRARQKGNTRKKIINGLTLHTVLLEDPTKIRDRSLADLYYDKINRIDLLEEAGQRSRDMFASALIRSTEITSAAIDVSQLKMEERVYIERPAAPEKAAQPQPAAAARRPEPARAAAPPPPKKDDLSEL
ncbi:MAG: hypothetical protein HY423_05825 [Candidatus Lambdaproteobacteria bacterium]|nr:hypothetical protein [Candidatus Lambdaproteobacteria bacterium]